MSIEQRITIACARCDGRGVVKNKKAPSIVCSCSAGKLVAPGPSVLPLFAAGAPAARVRKMG